MNNIELNNLAHKWGLKLKHCHFDEGLPKLIKGAYIVNLGDWDIGGTHWCSIWVNNDTVWYFDSFGFPPASATLEQIPKTKTLRWNEVQIQGSRQQLCGLYALYFLYYCNKGGNPAQFHRLFVSDVTKNDTVLKNLIRGIPT